LLFAGRLRSSSLSKPWVGFVFDRGGPFGIRAAPNHSKTMLKIKITRQILISGEVAKEGSIVEVDAATGRGLIWQGVAEIAQDEPEKDTVISTKNTGK